MSKPFTGHFALFAVAGSVLALAVFASTGERLRAQRRAPHVRTIPEVRVPIVDRLLPDDDIVVITGVEENGILPEHELTTLEVIKDAVAISDLIATVDIQEVKGLLTDDGMWINTRVAGTVQQVLSSKTLPPERGQRIEALYVGGETKIGKVLVRAGKAGAIQRIRRYLMFLELEPSTKLSGPLACRSSSRTGPW
jgi:hypothetical protein